MIRRISAVLLLASSLSVALLAQDAQTTPQTPAQDNTPRIDKREKRQQKRINQGVKSGALTKGEAARLEKQQAKIKNDEAAAKSDGKMTPQERRKLTKEQNAASRNIYRKKHNAKTQPATPQQ